MGKVKKKMKTLHVSAECYPAAKVGGLADVVGSLPKYLNKAKIKSSVVMPKYAMEWFSNQKYKPIHQGTFYFGDYRMPYQVEKVKSGKLGYDMYVVDIPGLLDRNGVYSDKDGNFFRDEVERYLAFSRAVLEWVVADGDLPDIIHCHDHHTGLIPFMMQYVHSYRKLKETPSVFTIHNERYQGAFSWDKQVLIGDYDLSFSGLLDWNDAINPLASAIKCAWKVTTVSENYLRELTENSYGLEWLFQTEVGKMTGILNGIDTTEWDPKTDKHLSSNLKTSPARFKTYNKKALIKGSTLDKSQPLVGFIGRLAYEKGADLVPMIIEQVLQRGFPVQFVILGSGDKRVEHALYELGQRWKDNVMTYIKYDEALARKIYAGCDFLIMPSRVEPCGLNQMYALRYGSFPIVHNVGGLHDTVHDLREDEANGNGFRTKTLENHDIIAAIEAAILLYSHKAEKNKMMARIMKLDYSWNSSAKKYVQLYKELTS